MSLINNGPGYGTWTPGGTNFTPKATPNIPYPKRLKLKGIGGYFQNGQPSPYQLKTMFEPNTIPGNENRGQYTETPSTLAKQRGSTSAPASAKTGGTGGSAPSLNSMPDKSQFDQIMRSM